ncbi:hypothetical protein GXP67_34195 [Rhodocytophaga rosea]|uniref:Uncharacterized protein n=1 Tax=Rhodocytophaga rosea TaxID=2704465 RepID=A0A6C0GVL6_9BACT|nr:hypothetical protein [Rhodocytophaga rosea]QHT71352.1 hypothetical protein GXP67_34195 [Rhodocytophaga rosea]
MINRNFLKKESIQLQKSYFEGWEQSNHNYERVCLELGQLRKRTKKK